MEPYVIKKDGKYEGFCIDIMDALAQRLNFRYEVIESPNNVYGNCMEFNNGTVSCDGMVKMLVDQVRNIFSIFFRFGVFLLQNAVQTRHPLSLLTQIRYICIFKITCKIII